MTFKIPNITWVIGHSFKAVRGFVGAWMALRARNRSSSGLGTWNPPEHVPRTSARAQTCVRYLGDLPACHGAESTRKDPRSEEKQMPKGKKNSLDVCISMMHPVGQLDLYINCWLLQIVSLVLPRTYVRITLRAKLTWNTLKDASFRLFFLPQTHLCPTSSRYPSTNATYVSPTSRFDVNEQERLLLGKQPGVLPPWSSIKI